MTDIVSANPGQDIGVFDTLTTKAANILSVQLGALEYAQGLGIDLEYFLSPDFKFQNSSFKAYLVQILSNNGINVSSVVDEIDRLFATYTFNINAEQTDTNLVAR